MKIFKLMATQVLPFELSPRDCKGNRVPMPDNWTLKSTRPSILKIVGKNLVPTGKLGRASISVKETKLRLIRVEVVE